MGLKTDITILLVENNIQEAMNIIKLLEEINYSVLYATNGEDAIETLLNSTHIKIILMNTHLGTGLDGIKTAEEIQRHKEIPIIFISPLPSLEAEKKTEGIQLSSYIEKYTEKRDLQKALENCLKMIPELKHENENPANNSLHLEELIEEKNRELIASEEKFRNIFNLSQSMICIADINTATFKTINPAFTKTLGYTEEELKSRTFLDFVHPDDKEETLRVVEEKLSAGESLIGFVNRYRCKDNTYKYLDWNSHPVPEEGITYAVANDITRIKESETQLNLIINESPFPIAVTDNSNELILYWSKSAEKLTGYSPKTVSEWESLAYPDKDHRNHYTDLWYSRMDRAKKSSSATNMGEYRITCKDGSVKTIEFYLQLIPNRSVITFNDITDRKKAENELLKHQNFLRKSQEIGIIGTWHLDLVRNILTYTEENYKIFEIEDNTPMNYELFLNCVHPEDREYVDTEWKKGIKNKSYDIEHRLLINGKEKWVREKAEFITNPQGIPQEAIGVTQDITNRKLYEFKIQKQLEEKEILLKEIHHRVKNNIANIESLLTLQSLSAEEENVIEALGNAISRVKSIRILYGKLLLSGDYQKIHIVDYIDNFIESMVSALSISDKITIEREISEFQIVATYAVNIGIIINELVTNALKYAFQNTGEGKIFISITKKEKLLTLIVKDNGIGINRSILENDASGFGMSIVKMLVEQLAGSLNINNQKGTKFTIQFNI